MNVTVIYGGKSGEHEVSLVSAASVARNIDKKHKITLIAITKTGKWFLQPETELERIRNDEKSHFEIIEDTKNEVFAIPGGGKERAFVVNGCEIPCDVVFPVLHGTFGEDGTIQGLFEMAGIPVVGCGVLSSALCMDKDRAHKLVHTAGIAVPSSFVLGKSASVATALQQAEKIGYPLFVKPVKAGSSFGITKVSSSNELPAALELAFEYDKRVIVEECISGFEVGCAILGDEDLTVGEVDEIELSGGFFNFTEKYTLKTSAIHVPARIPQNTAEQIKQAAKTIYRTLDCQGFARVDLFLTPSGEIVFNEVNTIPGFTTHSRYPNMMKAAGFTFEQIVSALIEQAVRE